MSSFAQWPSPIDPVFLTGELIRCPSITPEEGGALQLLAQLLEAGGFACTRVDRGGVSNLFARYGAKGAARSFGFNGHTDVVPVGERAAWSHDPFGGVIEGGVMYGRGACDMKSGVAAFAAAAVDFVRSGGLPADGAIVLALTGDEEGLAQNGTLALLDWMGAQGERMCHCLVGEPTCPEVMGEMMKIGRRGSLNCQITARGVQGHAPYPERARNPLPVLTAFLTRLGQEPLDEGSAHFDPSTLAITSIDCANPASNVIPAQATAALNIRFNDCHSAASLTEWLRKEAAKIEEETGVVIGCETRCSGESFVTPPGAFCALIADAVEAETGQRPRASTSGGTSDARFIKDHCPVVEFGLVGQSMHQVDERVEITHIEQLKAIYARVLKAYFV